MNITFANQTIDLIPEQMGSPRTIALMLSGGLDSASLMYLLCLHFPQIKIVPITGIDAHARFDALCAYDVINFMHEYFPQNNILNHEVFSFDHQDPEYMELALKMHADPAQKNNSDLALQPAGTSKNIQTRLGVQSIWSKCKELEWTVMATTANPPNQLMKARGFFDKAEYKRNEPHNRTNIRSTLHVPFINADKKFVAGIYKHYNLMDTLYPITNSCVGVASVTNYGTVDCGECFWCHEKKWGFE